MMERRKKLVELVLLCVVFVFKSHCARKALCTSVTYDGRALAIDRKRRILLSGSIHYPRTTPDVWPELIRKAKEGGLDVIDTYVFWNYHEPVKGQYYFEGRFDLAQFVKVVHEAGLFVHLRIGPHAGAEWNYGGFPMWLHFIPDIQFRTTNAPFKTEMELFLGKIIGLMKEENLFASQGGPIILAQVENEYGYVESSYGVGGKLYVQWAAETAVNMNTSVPWVMCMQSDAPDPIINTCNGFYCDQFTPNSPSKPKMWTANHVGWFLTFGNPIPYRPVEDLAFAVARFFELGGTFQNYYLYFGGSNFGRTAGGPLVATSYDYDAPLDEYGFIRQPKWGHLRDLHKALKLCEDQLVSSEPKLVPLGSNSEGHVYYKSSNDCAAFLANVDSSENATVQFNGNSYLLPAWSVSILPDCKTVVYNTAKVVSQRTVANNSFARTTTARETPITPSSWSWYKEHVGIWGNNSFTSSGLLEQINTTKDTSDFLWYTTSIYVDENDASNQEKEGHLFLVSLGHAALVFVNKEVVAFGFGNYYNANFSMTQKINLNPGNNTLDVLSMMIGLQSNIAWFDIQGIGPFSVVVDGLGNGKTDLSFGEWTYQVGLEGEYLGLDRIRMANSSLWTKGEIVPVNESLIWYKVMFSAPDGTSPLALNLASMGKGQAWVNGQSVGRYWPAYVSPPTGCTDNCDYRGSYDESKCHKDCGKPAQTLYHVPRSWINPGENLLVLHEEIGGDPANVSVLTRTGQEICAVISEADPSLVDSWNLNSELTRNGPQVRLSCEAGWRITSISFASFGNPQGSCGAFARGACHSDVMSTVEEACIGQDACSIPVPATANTSATANTPDDPCPQVLKSLAVEALCS